MRRRHTENPNGPIMVIVLLCMAVALTFTTFGLGILNLAKNNRLGPAPPAPPPSAVAEKKPGEDPLVTKVRHMEQEVVQQDAKVAQAQQTVQIRKGDVEKLEVGLAERRERLAALQKQFAALSNEVKQLRAKLAAQGGRSALLIQGEEKLAQARAQITALEQKIAALEQQLIDRKSVDPYELLGGERANRKAVMVECRRDGAVILPAGELIPIKDLNANRDFAQAVASSHVVLLVRPSSFGSFDEIRAAVEKKGAREIGYEPFDEGWLLRYQVEQRRARSNEN